MLKKGRGRERESSKATKLKRMRDSSSSSKNLCFSGKIYDKNASPTKEGLIASLENFVVNNHRWKFVHVAFNVHTSDFIAADERGQLYCFRMSENTYSSLRLASFPISSIEFVHSHASEVLVAYHNGLVVIVDIISREIVANVRPRGSSPILYIKCCPTKKLAVLQAKDGHIFLWNLRTLIAIETMQCKEKIVDVSFLAMTRWLSITFVKSGTVVYDLATLHVVMKCNTPPAERRPRLWTSFCSTASPNTGYGRASFSETSSSDSFAFLSGDNGKIYMFELKAQSSGTLEDDVPLCPLISVLELPSHVSLAVSMSIVSPRNVSPSISSHIFLVVLGDNGEVILLDGCISYTGSWQWCALHAFNPFVEDSRCLSVPSGIQLEPKFYPPYKEQGHRPESSSSYCLASCCLEMESAYFVIVTMEGTLHLYDWNAFMDKHVVECSENDLNSSGGGDAWFQQSRWLTTSGSMAFALNSSRSAAAVENVQEIHGRSSLSHSHDLSYLSPSKSTSSSGLTFSAQNRKRNKESDKTLPGINEGNKEKESSKKTNPMSQAKSDREKPSISMLLDSSAQYKALSVAKLQGFLRKYGQYPVEHRTLIWRVLLRLPENEKSFAGLVSRGTHERYEHLFDQYPIKERRVFKRLQGLCSQLAHWNAIFAEVDYLPQLALPFVVMFGGDELSALETVMTIIVWWGRSWQATFPNPPVHITDTLDVLLDKHDPNLRAHFYAMSVPPGVMGWKLLSTLFSEIIPSTEWQTLMDHLFAHVEEYTLIYLVPIALMKLLRPSLLAGTSGRQIISFLRQPQIVDIEKLLKILNQMKSETSSHLLSACYSGSASSEKEGDEASSIKKRSLQLNLSAEEKDLESARHSISAQEGRPIFPLPRGGYPAFDGYPPHLLDWQSKERAMVLSMKKEIRDQESCLEELRKKLETVEDSHSLWMQSHEKATEKEIQERKRMIDRDQRHLSELSVIEEKIAKQRIENLRRIEEIEAKELSAMEETKKRVQQMILESSDHMKQKVDQAVISQQHREAGEEADRVLQNKLQTLYMAKRKENLLKETEEALRLKEEELDKSNRVKISNWENEDLAAKLNRHQLSEQAKNRLHEHLIANQKREIEEKAKIILLEREAKLLEIERQRALRSIREAQSTKSFHLSEDELSKREEYIRSSLEMVSRQSAESNTLLSTHKRIRKPLQELRSLSQEIQEQSGREKASDDSSEEAALKRIQHEHEQKMAELAARKEEIISDKARVLNETLEVVRLQRSGRAVEVSESRTERDEQRRPSADSDDSDEMFQQALRFVTESSGVNNNIKNSNSESKNVESIDEDMIISAIEIVSRNKSTPSSSQKSKRSPSSSALRESSPEQLDRSERRVAAEIVDMLSISSASSVDQAHPEVNEAEAGIAHEDMRWVEHSQGRRESSQRSSREIFESETRMRATDICSSDTAALEHSSASDASSKSLEVLERIVQKAYSDLEQYDEDSLKLQSGDGTNIEQYELSKGMGQHDDIMTNSPDSISNSDKNQAGFKAGERSSNVAASSSALWAYAMSGREEFKELASEFSEDELYPSDNSIQCE